MADRRRSRFRLPWMSRANVPRPSSEPQPPRPVAEVQSQDLPTTDIPKQRPQFRPTGVASAQPPQQVQASQKAAPGPPSSPPATAEPQSSFPAVSPSRAATRKRIAALPPSPSSADTESKGISEPTPPLLKTTRTRATSKTHSASNATPQPRAASISLSALRTPGKSQRSDSTTNDDYPRVLSKPVKEIQESEEQKEVLEEPKIKGKRKVFRNEGPVTSTKTKLLPAASRSTEQAKDSGEEKTKLNSFIHPEATIEASESHQRHAMSKREAPQQKEIREDIVKFVHKMGAGETKLPLDQNPVSILTLAGENRGAFMHLGSESESKNRYIHITRGYKTNPDESTEATTNTEESSEDQSKDSSTKEDIPTNVFINNNTQGTNNSIVSQTIMVERNPGVHLVLSQNLAKPTKDITEPEPPEPRKAEFKVTPVEKLTYKPRVRRRCLRGLFLESSDSDPENPEKPRRHGCRYNCGKKENE